MNDAPPPPAVDIGTRAARGTAWSLGGQLVSQVLRLASNLVLTRLLAPEAFGLMALVVAVTQGLQLISDVGIWQAIVGSQRGDDRDFLDTAWTLHVVRGFGLFAIGCAAAWPASVFYGRPELLWMLPLCSFQAVLMGVESTKTAQETRHLRVGRVVLMDLSMQTVGLCVSIPVAIHTHSPVALVVASLAGSAVRTALSHFFLPGTLNRLRWDPAATREILSFGRFVFVSTIFYFLGTKYDVFALGRLEGMGVIGVYGIGLTIVGVPQQMCERVTYSVLMPALAERFRESPERFHADLEKARAILLPAAAVLFLGAAMCAPAFFRLLYPAAYDDAGWMVQLLVLTTWCMFLQESTGRAHMALGNSGPLAIANAARLVATIAATSAGFYLGAQLPTKLGPMMGFMIGNSVGALTGAVVIGAFMRKHGVHIGLLDLIATAAFVAVGLVGCGVPVLVARETGLPAPYLTLVSVVVVLGPIAIVVARRTRAALRASRAAAAP